MKSQFDIRKDRKETLISCSKDKFGPEKKEIEFSLMEFSFLNCSAQLEREESREALCMKRDRLLMETGELWLGGACMTILFFNCNPNLLDFC